MKAAVQALRYTRCQVEEVRLPMLEQGIADMKDEILRYEAEIKKKKAHKEAMSSLFKS